jgi:dihydrofolate reductase
MSEIALIVAASENNVIGRKGAMPWRLPADLAHFKRTTMGKQIVMGRRTFEAIGRALPGRRNIVVTRRTNVQADGIQITPSLEGALVLAGDAPEVMIIGGGELYRTALPLAQRIYLTRVQATITGDTVFPELNAEEWREVSREERAADDKNPYALSFLVLERKTV